MSADKNFCPAHVNPTMLIKTCHCIPRSHSPTNMLADVFCVGPKHLGKANLLTDTKKYQLTAGWHVRCKLTGSIITCWSTLSGWHGDWQFFCQNSPHYQRNTWKQKINPVSINAQYMLTSGGPPRKMVPFCFTMMLSSAIAGTYAPPAVQLPMTTAICGIPHEDIMAWL